ncbi:glycosyltransferase [Gordonia aichiensis]
MRASAFSTSLGQSRAPDVSPPTAINQVVVVVPAHNEEDLLHDCLASVLVAADNTPCTVTVTVVLDACTDSTARRVPLGVDVIACTFASVGAARRAGFAQHESQRTHVSARTWFASTDADSRVPSDWLAQQVAVADTGADCYLGTVTPDGWTGWTPGVAQRYAESYRHEEGHGHIHGANFGIRASTYDAVGGFAPIPHGEDVELVHRVRASGALIVASHRAPVVTSTRARGRADHGFAAHLRSLAQAAGPVAAQAGGRA